ncbi:serine/threonine-protein kinase [Actinosynnema sp. NPDC020468]|uniref:serine/threonine-protein kinase n=1 Tax=Actinosynnema sp. NPDC020468 TaxID=3154488 RepID=UPI0033FAC2BE
MVVENTLVSGRFRVGRKLGEGGGGQVYAVRDIHSGRNLAMKIQAPRLPFVRTGTYSQDGAALVYEKEVGAELSEVPGLVVAEEGAEFMGRHFFVMERIEGPLLAKFIEDRTPVDTPSIAAVLAQVCGTLACMHERGYAHRDVKSENVSVEWSGRVRLLDVGFAEKLSNAHDFSPTGTPGYVAPELSSGKHFDERSDIFSAGCVLFEMAVMKLPYPHFSGHAPVETEPFSPHDLDQMDPTLRQLGLAMIAWDPDHRPRRIPEVLAVLRSLLPKAEAPKPPRRRPPDPVRWLWAQDPDQTEALPGRLP